MEISEELKGKKVLITTFRNFSFVLHQELFIANILARKGAEVYYVLDDGLLPHWDTYQIQEISTPLNPSLCLKNKIVESILTMAYRCKRLNKLYLSDFINTAFINENMIHLSEYDEKNCVSSVRRYFQCGKFDRDNIDHVEYYNLCRKNCIMVKMGIENIISQIQPDIGITSHGIYSIWGSAYGVFQSHDIHTYIYGAHAYNSDTTFFTDTLCQTLTLDKDAQAYMNSNEFGEDEYKQINKYFADRRSHSTKDTSIYYSWMNTIPKEKKNNEEKKNIPTFCLFTNIIWDGDVAQRDTIFDGMLMNTIYTINKFRQLPYNLIVRIHPAEATLWKDSVKMNDILHKEIPDIDSIPNVRIIDSSEPIDTYQFVKENIDIALVYDGILSIELTALKIPVIAAAVTRYANGDYVISPKSIGEYNKWLENPGKCKLFLDEDKIFKMHKFAYWFIFKAGYTFPLFDDQEFGKICFNDHNLAKMNSTKYTRFVNKLTNSVKNT